MAREGRELWRLGLHQLRRSEFHCSFIPKNALQHELQTQGEHVRLSYSQQPVLGRRRASRIVQCPKLEADVQQQANGAKTHQVRTVRVVCRLAHPSISERLRMGRLMRGIGAMLTWTTQLGFCKESLFSSLDMFYFCEFVCGGKLLKIGTCLLSPVSQQCPPWFSSTRYVGIVPCGVHLSGTFWRKIWLCECIKKQNSLFSSFVYVKQRSIPLSLANSQVS